MAKLDITEQLNDPYGSEYFRRLDALELLEINLLSPRRIDIIANNDKLDIEFFLNRVIDDLNIVKYRTPVDKSKLTEAEIAMGDR